MNNEGILKKKSYSRKYSFFTRMGQILDYSKEISLAQIIDREGMNPKTTERFSTRSRIYSASQKSKLCFGLSSAQVRNYRVLAIDGILDQTSLGRLLEVTRSGSSPESE